MFKVLMHTPCTAKSGGSIKENAHKSGSSDAVQSVRDVEVQSTSAEIAAV